MMEAAITTIADCEDSIAAVDAEDKALVYRNWHGLMSGTLGIDFSKDGQTVRRRLNPDRVYTDVCGGELTLPGRSLLLVRNVGIHMYTDAVITAGGRKSRKGFSTRWSPPSPRSMTCASLGSSETAAPVACTSSSQKCMGLMKWPRRLPCLPGSRKGCVCHATR